SSLPSPTSGTPMSRPSPLIGPISSQTSSRRPLISMPPQFPSSDNSPHPPSRSHRVLSQSSSLVPPRTAPLSSLPLNRIPPSFLRSTPPSGSSRPPPKTRLPRSRRIFRR